MFKRLYYILAQRLYVFRRRHDAAMGKVYMFHKVDEDGDIYAISPDNFKEMLKYLLRNRRIVDIETLIREKDPDNVLITFDDVYRSVYDNAFPLLKEAGVPYYLFVCNEYLNRDGYLDEKMLKEMLENSGAILGCHFYQHVLSRFMAAELFEKELIASKEELEKITGRKIGQFAFPYGSIYACSKENISCVLKHFDQVFMTYNLPYNGEYGNIIPRININDRTYKGEIR